MQTIKNLICIFCAFIIGFLFIVIGKLADEELAKMLLAIFSDAIKGNNGVQN